MTIRPDLPGTRGWDRRHARFSLLSAIASGTPSLSSGSLPGGDVDDWARTRERDSELFARWVRFAEENVAVLSRLEDLFDEPRPGGVIGRIALGEDGRGLVFLANPDYVEHRLDVPLGDGRLLREIHPEPGRLWGATVAVEAHEVHVCEVVLEADVLRPALLGAAGTADEHGRVVTAKGRPGSIARVEALLRDDRRAASLIVFAEDGVTSSLGPWSRTDGTAGADDTISPAAVLADLEGDVRLCAEWAPGQALAGMLARLAPPVGPPGDEQAEPWFDPARLHLLVDLAVPQPATVRAAVDGGAVEVRRADIGTWPEMTGGGVDLAGSGPLAHYLDLTDHLSRSDDPERRWRIDLEIDGLAKGSLRGVHVAHLPRRTTTELEEVDLLGSAWFEAVADLPTEAPLLPGITVGELLKAHGRRPDPPGTVFEHDVVYGRGGDTDLLCSVYRRADRSEHRPAVVFVHGGGWSGGDRSFHIRHAHYLAERGYVAVDVEYRLYPQALWPDALQDVKCAVRWLRAHAAELGADPDRVGIAGGSAGGHLAAMAALTPGRFEGSGGWAGETSAVQAAVLWYPATDIVDMLDYAPRELTDVMAPYFARHEVEASPVSHVHAGAPPMLIITGERDSLTKLTMIERFHAELDAAGVDNRLEVFPERDHGFDLLGPDWQDPTELMAGFFSARLDGDGAAGPTE